MSRKATLDALFGVRPVVAPELKSADGALGIESLGAPNTSQVNDPAESGRIRSGAIGAMGASLQQLKESAREADALRQSLSSGERVAALDPALIDAAPVADRFRQNDDAALSGLVESIRDSGQQVPVLVRPHPSKEGRWQVAYGHRRIRACAILGLPVQAIIRSLTEAELAVAQGKENLERRDLSFIEKAFFAAGLEDAGFDRGTIMQALGADKADVSRYVAIARSVPEDLTRLIGPAPRAGRARWQELSETVARRSQNRQPLADLLALLPQLAAFQRADSDGRFRLVMARLSEAPKAAAEVPLVSDGKGRHLVLLKGQGRRRQIEVDETLAPGFAAFVAAAVPELYARWLQADADTITRNQE
jgi:ParB family transcriptional regulator, chromosome partitioning protein